ncbi:MAG: hypothetical protein U0527_05970 [Candidatus Eisenbacteria bacterium]
MLPSLDLKRTLAFYESKLGFQRVIDAAEYAGVARDQFEIHFWLTTDAALPPNSSCRIEVVAVESLYRQLEAAGVIHPNGALTTRRWGFREFSAQDPDGNLVTFVERVNEPALIALAHVNVTCRLEELPAMRAFYAERLGLAATARPEGAGDEGAWFRIGHAELHISVEADLDNSRSRRHVAYEAPDLDALRRGCSTRGTTSRGRARSPGSNASSPAIRREIESS